jgi:two-component system CheB/CheR fusion protein
MPEKKLPDQKLSSSSYFAAIGASAGGLEAINELFENMPENTGISFFLIQHLSSDHKSLMTELLSKHTTMPVIEAQHNVHVKPNSIYVIPSTKFMTIQHGKLQLQEKGKSKSPNNAIDIFFESLAKDKKNSAIGIVLSGTGSVGSKGVEAIKENGGIVIVQDPVTAAFDGMPNSALATGTPDLICPPENIALELLSFLNESPAVKSFHAQNHKAEFNLRDLLLKIRQLTALDFSHYKRPTLFRRLAKRMSELAIVTIEEYQKYLDTHPEEVHVISKEFLINVSSFFRDKEAFEIIRTVVIPSIMKNKQKEDTVKTWSVACSTGEEAYSTAILFKEYLEKNRLHDITIKIFATDIDRDALDIASRGIYSKSNMQDISPNYISKYFIKEDDVYRVSPEIRKMVVFSYHDILKDPPFSRMDLISCRNMLIYINAEQQKEILKKLHFALNIEGFLFLGSSENIGIMKSAVQEIDKKWKIYKCIAKMRLSEHDTMFAPLEKRPILPQAKPKNALQHIPELFNEALVEENKYAGIYINKEMEVKQAVGNYKNFIDFPEGGFNFNLMKLVKPELSIALSVAIRKSIKDNTKIVVKDVRIHEGNQARSISIIIKPYLEQKEYLQPFLFVVLSEDEKDTEKKTEVFATDSIESEQRIADLEKELNETRANLQAVIEEVETSNEELQSTNEEMISTNEELQSTNEELQSLNEELHTVSAEHQIKIKELSELNDDLNNYFKNSDTGQILVDRKLIVRKFTPAVKRMISLIDTDVNRSLLDITNKIQNLDLIQDIKNVIRTETATEREISLLDNSIYLMRITPYIRNDRTLDGVVVSFVDVTEIKKLGGILQAVFNTSLNAIYAMKAIRNKKNEIVDFEYIAANIAFANLTKLPVEAIQGKRISELFPSLTNPHLSNYIDTVNTGNSNSYDFYDEQNNRWYEITLAKMMDGLVVTSMDVTDKKKAADVIAQSYINLQATSNKLVDINSQLEKSNMDLLQFASVASHDLKEPLRKIQTFGNLLNTRARDKFEGVELGYLQKIIKSSERMQSLIEDVLTLSKLSNETIPFEEVDLNETFNNIIDDFEIIIREKGALIQIGDLPTVNAVPGQMHQLFQNLISNSLKFSDDEVLSITISKKILTPEITKQFGINPKKYFGISVKDNGIGFEEQFKQKIFGIFQRLNGNQYEGTGIGLAICKKIMDNHKGFLLADGKLHEGAEFIALLPK